MWRSGERANRSRFSQYESMNDVGVSHCKENGNQPAVRAADHICGRRIRRSQKRGEIVSVHYRRIWYGAIGFRKRIGWMKAPAVGERSAPSRKCLELCGRHVESRVRAVHEYHRNVLRR